MADILGIGIKLPIDVGNNGWFNQSRDSYEALKTDIKCLLNTIPGERIMQPELGLNLLPYVFEPINNDTVSIIINKIRTTIGFWLPYVVVKDINVDVANENIDRNEINISITFSIGNNDVVDYVTFKV